MLLRKHPFSFLRPLFLYRSYKPKEPPLRVALLVFSSHGEPRQVQEVRRADAHPQGEAGACSSRGFEGAAFSRAAVPLPEAHHRDCSRRGDVRRCRWSQRRALKCFSALSMSSKPYCRT